MSSGGIEVLGGNRRNLETIWMVAEALQIGCKGFGRFGQLRFKISVKEEQEQEEQEEQEEEQDPIPIISRRLRLQLMGTRGDGCGWY